MSEAQIFVMGPADAVGLVVSLLICIYLVYALIRGESL